jgi:hypothetical protein
MQLKQILISFIFLLLLSGCEKVDKDEQIPAYIYIDSIDLQVKNDGSQGSNAHDIQDAWIFANGEMIGVFELPCVVPILKKDSVEIMIYAGIKANGQSNNRRFYPFYDIYKKKVYLKPTEIDTLQPVVTYKQDVKFPWIEDFEDFAVSMQKSGVTRTVDTMLITNKSDEVFMFGEPGNKYTGKVNFRSKIGTFENSTIDLFDLPRATSDIYLEVNYRSDVAVQFGLYPSSGTSFDFGVAVYLSFANPKEWKKAYIRLSEDVNNQEYTGKKFRIFINAVNPEDKPAVVLLDNIKLLHF